MEPRIPGTGGRNSGGTMPIAVGGRGRNVGRTIGANGDG